MRINHKSCSFGDAQEIEHAVLTGNFLFRITQQRECQAQLFGKAAVGRRLVDADSQNLCAGPFEMGKTILVCRQFPRSARRVCVDVKSQNDTALAAEVTQPKQAACVIRQFKIRRRVSDVQCHSGRLR